MKCALIILANRINKLQETVGRSKKASARLKRSKYNKFFLYKITTKILTKEERLNFLKTWKTRFRENLDFGGFTVTLTGGILCMFLSCFVTFKVACCYYYSTAKIIATFLTRVTEVVFLFCFLFIVVLFCYSKIYCFLSFL